jgi:hypothetical protein
MATDFTFKEHIFICTNDGITISFIHFSHEIFSQGALSFFLHVFLTFLLFFVMHKFTFYSSRSTDFEC